MLNLYQTLNLLGINSASTRPLPPLRYGKEARSTEFVKMTNAVEQASFRMSYSESEKGLFDTRKFWKVVLVPYELELGDRLSILNREH